MTARYRFDPGQSRFTVQAFVAGLLSFAGHSPTFAVRDFQGTLSFGDDERKIASLDLTANPDALELTDRVSPADRKEIEDRTRRDVLETSAYREVRFEAADLVADPIAPGRYRLRVAGRLTLHGVTRHHQFNAELQRHEDALRLLGDCQLRLSDHRIKPVTALGGTIKLKDELTLTFDLIGLREQGGP